MSGPNTSGQQAVEANQVALGDLAAKEGKQVFNETFPGLTLAENYYQTLASGDPKAIQRAVAPAEEQIIGNTEAAKQNIKLSMPRGGAEDLALAQADISKASQVGNLATQAYTSSFPALANLAQGGIGLSVNEIANAISAFGGAATTEGNIANQQAQGKSGTLGFLGSLAGAAGQYGGDAALAGAIAA